MTRISGHLAPLGVIVVASILALWLSASLRTAGAPPVEVRDGAAPIMDGEDVAAIARSRLEQLAEQQPGRSVAIEIVQLTAVRGADLSLVEARAPVEVEPALAAQTVWFVRAQGPFIATRTRPGQAPPAAETGYFIISDTTGEIIGYGLP